MKKGFTLIELLVVITIIAILAGLTLGAGGILRDKAARSRASGEIAALDTALERYKIDNGDYPDTGNAKSTIISGNNLYSNNTGNYVGGSVTITPATSDTRGNVAGQGTNGGIFLFASLMGRLHLTDTGSNQIAYPQYIEVKSGQVTSNSTGDYFKDPYSNAYGYYYDASGSTPSAASTQGVKSLFNVVEPDIWSTGGQSTTTPPSTDSTNQSGYAVYLKWIKNWASQ